MALLGGKLPDELTMEILSRVPPESLVHFRCVSKSWYALINDPKLGCFLPNHRNILLKRFVKNKETGKNETRFSFVKYPLPVPPDDDDDTSVEIEVEDLHFPSFGEEFECSIFGHSHGLVCLLSDFETISLYNPVTKEFRKLPPSILDISPDNVDLVQSFPGGMGSGYDPKSSDFKVVRIVDFVPIGTDQFDSDLEEDADAYLPSRAEVYDLRKDEWREINTPVPGRVFECYESSIQLYYQGFYYWLAASDELRVRDRIIMWFDMSQELFGQIPLPEGFDKEDHGSYLNLNARIEVLNGSIVLFDRFDDRNPVVNKIRLTAWEMVKLDGGVVSWSKLFTIDHVPGLEKPLAFVGSDQLLLDTYKGAGFDTPGYPDGQLVLYNIKTQKLKKLSLEGCVGMTQAIVFVKTLFSVNVNGGHTTQY